LEKGEGRGLENNIIQDMGLGSKGNEHDKVEFGFLQKMSRTKCGVLKKT
jgi:hypothetical protein